ncbi:uncharacterized protein E0L32_009898 [Thyridium curvatum]|uniref:Uncharacterized protein n=1 Tax=Thyridium curvatum TaxID=1093900 RepID=A0A507AUV0_9PEZI|nr:uncharacterized protein E0L32_009898 [Thyridium curvatum]TPX08709.1 hypothetical protein E0L32_009898 [Thyridium curvatum]
MAPQHPIEPSSPFQDDENAELFSAVSSVLKKEELPRLGSTVLRRRMGLQGPFTSTKPAVGEPMYGSFHVIFPLIFADGLRWAVKIPINGTAASWDAASASALVSEAKTMRLLKRETTIPLPDVLDFSSTVENPLQCPYIILSFIDGKPLYNVWFSNRLKGDNPETTHLRRVRALETIASAMLQMNKFSFQAWGSPRFDEAGDISDIGPLRTVDEKAMLDRWFIHKDPDDSPIYVQVPTSGNPSAYYSHMLDLHPGQSPFLKGVELLLRQLISWIPEPDGMDPFVLNHPDYDIQNFIVSDEGELVGVIDWDGVAATPRTLGNERYPGWLTRDWDPAMYGWTEAMESGEEPEGVWEDSPETLRRYRVIYDNIMARNRAESGHSPGPNFCRMSLVTDNLAIAADNPRCRDAILRKMVHEIWVAAGEDSEPQFLDLVEMFADEDVDVAVLETLRHGFAALLTKEGL